MSSRRRDPRNQPRPEGRRRQRRRDISVRTVRRTPPDLHKLGRAIIRLAILQAEAERAARHVTDEPNTSAGAAS